MNFQIKRSWPDKIFGSVDDFYTKQNLMKFFRETYDKDAFFACRKVLRMTANYAEKAYKVGVEEGLAGNPEPTTDGLQELVKDTKYPEDMEAIYRFIYDACVSGYAVGKAKRDIMQEVKNNGSV